MLLKQFKTSVIATLVLAVIVSGLYPALVWVLAQAMFSSKANGSLIDKEGKPAARTTDVVGSALIGQNFSDAKYFHPRPSSAGNGYDPTASGGSNLGPTSAKLINGTIKKDDKGKETVDFDGIHLRILHYCIENKLAYDSSLSIKEFQDAQGNLDDEKLIKAFNDKNAPLRFMPGNAIPADAVTASASGLDPDISPANAHLQAPRVAEARHLSVAKVKKLIEENTEGPTFGLLGDPRINVLRLNLTLDRVSESRLPAAREQPRRTRL